METLEILKFLAFFVTLFLLVISSSFLSCSELSLAASKKFKIQRFFKHDEKVKRIFELKSNPGEYFAAVQIGLNLVAIIAGALGQDFLSPYLKRFFFSLFDSEQLSNALSSIIAVLFITTIFIIFADLMPKKLAISNPEKVAYRIVNPMFMVLKFLRPFIVFFDGVASFLLRFFHKDGHNVTNDEITVDDIQAIVRAGTEAGLLVTQEQYLFERIFSLKNESVTNMMTHRDHIDFYHENTPVEEVINSLDGVIHQRVPICKEDSTDIIGYVYLRQLLHLYISEGNTFKITDERIFNPALFIPDTLTLYEVLDYFNHDKDDFAIVLNEYGLVVGLVTVKDVMMVMMGDLVPVTDGLITQRDDSSWLISGATPCKDVFTLLGIKLAPNNEQFETLNGLIMFLLKRIPQAKDRIRFKGFSFEVIAMEQHRIKQVLVKKD